MLERLVLPNAAQRNSRCQMDFWSSTYDHRRSLARSLDHRSIVARSLDLSAARSLGRSVARPLGRSVARPLDCLVARPPGRSVAQSLDRSVTRSLGSSVVRRWVPRLLGCSAALAARWPRRSGHSGRSFLWGQPCCVATVKHETIVIVSRAA